MKLDFYDDEGNFLVSVVVDTDVYDDACLMGNNYLFAGTINGASDFDISEEEYARIYGSG